jgi:hypothetical protein
MKLTLTRPDMSAEECAHLMEGALNRFPVRASTLVRPSIVLQSDFAWHVIALLRQTASHKHSSGS